MIHIKIDIYKFSCNYFRIYFEFIEMRSNTPNGSRYIGTTQSVHSSLAAQ